MAATKVDVRPPSSSHKDQASCCETPSCSSGLNAICSPKLSSRSFKAFSGGSSSVFADGASFVSSKLQCPKHLVYKATSFSRSHDADLSQSRAGNVEADSEKALANDCKSNGCTNKTAKGANPSLGSFIGLLRGTSLHPFSPLNATMGLGKFGWVGFHHYNSFPPLRLPTPMTQHQLQNHQPEKPGAAVAQSLVHSLTHFEVKCRSENGKEVAGSITPFKEERQLCQQDNSVSQSEDNSDGELVVKSWSGSEEATSKDSNLFEEACSDDEMPRSIHGNLKGIHANVNDVATCEYCLSDFDDSGIDGLESSNQLPGFKGRLLATPTLSKDVLSTKTPYSVTLEAADQSTNSDGLHSTAPAISKDPPLTGKACLEAPPSIVPSKLKAVSVSESLAVKCTSKTECLTVEGSCCKLKKLLSDESGFYDATSPTLPSEASCGGLNGWWQQDDPRQESDDEVPCGELNGWWQQDGLRQESDEEEEEEWDWEDEDECGDDACQPGESADDLWRSFEECIFSPQCPMIPPTRSPVTPVISQLQRSSCTAEGVDASQCQTRSIDSPTLELRQSEVTREHCRAGQTEHDTTHCATTSHDNNRASHAVSMATGTLVGRSRRKQVHFPEDSEISVTHVVVVWRFAYQAARKGPWEQLARDRAHFRRRIDNLSSVLESCLRSKIAKMSTHIQNS